MTENLMKTYAIIDAARDYARIAIAEHCCYWSESLFSGPTAADLSHVAPHLYACDLEGTVAWLTLRGHHAGEAGIVLESELNFKQVRRELRRRLMVERDRSGRRAFFRFYDPRVLRAFLPACTAEELLEFFGPIRRFHCQSKRPLYVLSFSLEPNGKLQVEERHIDDYLVHAGYCTPGEIAAAQQEFLAS